MKNIFYFIFLILTKVAFAQKTSFEISNGTQTATYFEAINFYKTLDKNYNTILVQDIEETDAGYPLNVVLISNDAKFDPVQWHKQNKVVVLINNGIHPGEPDGIDASMLLVRDIATKKVILPNNVVLALIPVYNIGGCLNRGSTSRANQNGPIEYGFRGNAQNLDLNRDFTKCDSKEAKSFTTLFHWLDADILIDNHVSDGADYQYTFTLLTTQYNKLGNTLGTFLKNTFEPQLYKGMEQKNWETTPYVNFETASFDKGMEMFYDPPRYSSGYASLFNTIAFVPETHMLKPFKDRVLSTYAFMQTVIERAGSNANELLEAKAIERKTTINEISFALSWVTDSTKNDFVNFKGYEQAYKVSDVSGQQRMYYDRTKPFTKLIKYYNTFKPTNRILTPKAYIIPQGWQNVIELLKLNKVALYQFVKDTSLEVEAYKIEDYKSYAKPYEKHHKNFGVKTSTSTQKIKFLKGDYIAYLNQQANRYLIEMLEPTGDDSFFTWNFFDAILQQKEGYSDYRWEDVAAEILKNNTDLKVKLEEKKKGDEKFAKNAAAQLEFVYKNSNYYEPAHNRYPVYRLIK